MPFEWETLNIQEYARRADFSPIARTRTHFLSVVDIYLAFPLPPQANQSGPKRCAPVWRHLPFNRETGGSLPAYMSFHHTPNPLTTSSISAHKFSTCFPQISTNLSAPGPQLAAFRFPVTPHQIS